MTLISLFDLISLISSGIAFFLVISNLKSTFPTRKSLILFTSLLFATIIYSLLLFLEWSNISIKLEKFEDSIGAMLPMFWAIVLYSFSLDIFTRDLQISEQKLRGVFDQTFQFIGLLDLKGSIIEVNNTALEIVSTNPSKVLGKPAWETIWFNHTKKLQKKLKSAVKKAAKGELVRFEATHPAQNGNLFYVDFSLKPVRNNSDEIVMLIAEGRDITDRKQVEETLKQLSKDQETLLDISRSLTTSLDINVVLQKVIDKSTQLCGLDAGAIYLIQGSDLYLGASTPPITPEFPDEYRFAKIADHPNINKAISTRKPHVLTDTKVADLSPAEQVIIEPSNIRTIVYVPLTIQKRVVGILIMSVFKNPRLFTENEIELYASLSNQAALAIENARLFDETQHNVKELEQLILKRKEAERKLQKSQMAYQDLYDNAPDMFFSIDSKTGKILQCNNTVVSVLGYDKNEIVGQPVFSFYHSNCLEKAKEAFQLFKTTGELNDVELCVIRKNGTLLEVSLNASAVYSEDGKIINSRSIWRDISGRKKAEKALMESEDKYRNLIEQSNDGIIIGQNGKLVFANNAIANMLGYSIEELDGIPFMDLIHPNERNRLTEIHNRRMAGEKVTNIYETIVLCKDTSKIFVEVNTSIITFQGEPAVQSMIRDITERKLAEEELNKLSTAIKQSPVSVVITDPKGNIEYVNPKFCELTGYSEAEIRGKNPRILKSDNTPIETYKKLWETISSGKEWRGEFYNRKKNGELYCEYAVVSPVVDENGEITHYIAVKEDITARKKAEGALQETENKMQSIFRVVPTGIGVVKNRILIDVNPRVCEMVGYSPDDLIGKSSRVLYPTQEEFEYVGKEKYRQINDYGTGVVETRWLRKNGKIIDVLLSSTPIDIEDLSKGVTFTALDISERKKAEKDLQESENKLTEAQNIAKLGYYVFDLKSESWSNSDELNNIFGIDNNYKKSIDSWLKIVHPDYRESMKEYMIEHVLKHRNKFDKQYKIINLKTQQEKWVHGLGSLKFDENNEPKEMFGTIQDITEFKKLEEHLTQSQKMESIGQLTAGIAHDYNNIITAINGFSKLALMGSEKNTKIWNFLNEILDAGNRAANLTSQLLTFSRKQIIEPKLVDVNSIITRLDKMLSTIVGDSLSLCFNLEESISPVKADVSQLEQIIVNLVINARDAIIEKGTPLGKNKISIETKEKYLDESFVKTHADSSVGYHILISVSDTGSGVDQSNLSKIFEPFYSTKEEGKGTGLGLSTVYGIVKQNSGSIYVYSEIGQGSKFDIYWPCMNKEKKHFDDIINEDEIIGGTESILIVDDDKSVADFVKNFLNSIGYKVFVEQNGKDALEFSKQNVGSFKLLLTDVSMPEMNGKELVDELLKLMPELKVIYGSGYSGEHISNGGILEDNVNFISKPYSINTLAKKIREVLDKDR